MSDERAETTQSSRRAVVGFAVVLILAAALMVIVTQSASLLENGAPAPPFELEGIDGSTTSLESLRGKVVLLDFWSTTCPPCLRQMEELEAIHERFHRDVVVLGINTEGAGAAFLTRFLADRGTVRYRVLRDGAAVSEQYQVTALPTLYLIDRAGRVRWSRVGLSPAALLEEALRDLL